MDKALSENLSELYELKRERMKLQRELFNLTQDIAKLSKSIYAVIDAEIAIVTPELLERGVIALSSDGDCSDEYLIEFMDAISVESKQEREKPE